MRIVTNRVLRSALALMLAACLLVSAVPAAFAASRAGTEPSDLKASSTKTYIKLSRSVVFFTGKTYGAGTRIAPSTGAVCQLLTDDWYTASDGLDYHRVYYMNQLYNVLRSDVQLDILSASELESYIKGTLWSQSSYTTLRESMDLVGDVRVHALQLALKQLGYYDGKLDGNYGKGTATAVKKFQKAQGLDADGVAGPLTQPVLFALAGGTPGTPGTSGGSSGGSSSGGSSSGGSSGGSSSGDSVGAVPGSGTLRTTASVNLRRNASTSALRLAVVPKGVNLAYTDTYTKNGITWYQVRYNKMTGWLMGTYVSAKGSSTSPAIGTVTITKAGTRVRDAADGNKTGTVLAKGTVVDLLAQPTSAGGYSWYNIRTGSGLVGFVRGDCVSVGGGTSGGSGGSSGGSSGGGSGNSLIISTDKGFVKLPANTSIFLTDTKPSSGSTTVSAGTVLMLYSTTTYTKDGVEYCSLYYNNKKYNAVYADVKSGIMNSTDLAAYLKSLLTGNLNSSLKRINNHTGDVRVYALQSGLKTLGYYTGNLDGTYGAGTQSAVRNFQRAVKINVDGSCGTVTWKTLAAKLYGTGSSSGSAGDTSDGGITVTDFGTVNAVRKVSWNYDDNGGAVFPKGTYATIMDVSTGKCFQVYRWSGGSHADCVPASSSDTKIMCDIVGFPYNSNHPSSSQLSKIKSDGDSSVVTYTWPDFKNAFGGAKDIGSAWDRRAALININGTVYPVSIYGFPHGFNGTDSFSKSKFPNGQYFYAANNYYGMMCVHFPGSKTHGGSSPDSKHQAAIETAYSYAKSQWPTLVK